MNRYVGTVGKCSTILIGSMFFLFSLYPITSPGVMMVSIFITIGMFYLCSTIASNPTKGKAIFLFLTGLFLAAAEYHFGYFWDNHTLPFLFIRIGGLGYVITAMLTFFLTSERKKQNLEASPKENFQEVSKEDV